MKKTKFGNIYAQVAAFCLVLYCMMSISIIAAVVYCWDYYDCLKIDICRIIEWIAAIGMAASVVMNSRKGVAIAAGVRALLCVYYLMGYLGPWSWHCSIVCPIAYAALIAVTVLSLKEKPVVKKIWFIPGALMLLYTLIEWARYDNPRLRIWLLCDVVLCVGIILAGMWLRSFGASTQAAPEKNRISQILVLVAVVFELVSFLSANYIYYNFEGKSYFYGYKFPYSVLYEADFAPFFLENAFEYAFGYFLILGFVALLAGFIMGIVGNTSAAPQKGTSAPVASPVAKIGSDADRLKALKELLDTGALTQEEFEEKKKQVLGL